MNLSPRKKSIVRSSKKNLDDNATIGLRRFT